MLCCFLAILICPVLKILAVDNFVTSVRKIILWHI